jgi:hypothetical protein
VTELDRFKAREREPSAAFESLNGENRARPTRKQVLQSHSSVAHVILPMSAKSWCEGRLWTFLAPGWFRVREAIGKPMRDGTEGNAETRELHARKRQNSYRLHGSFWEEVCGRIWERIALPCANVTRHLGGNSASRALE